MNPRPGRLTVLHILGQRAYGDAWSVMRPALVFLLTNGRTQSSKDLDAEELEIMTLRLSRTAPLWPRTSTSLHRWADEERARAEEASSS